MRALVVFSGRTDLRWLRLLKPGFRHCFVAIHDGRHWLTLDPLASRTELRVEPVPPDADLAAWYRGLGLTVVETAIARPVRPAAWAPFTCVEAVKRAIGLQAWWVVTPWQLYRRLARPLRRNGLAEAFSGHARA